MRRFNPEKSVLWKQRAGPGESKPAQAEPFLAPRLLLVASLGAAITAVFGTGIGPNMRPAEAQVAVAILAATIALAVVPAALIAAGRDAVREKASSPGRLLGVTLALLSTGAASIHFVVISAHFGEWWGFGAFFATTGVIQLVWAMLAVTRPSRRLFLIGAIGNGVIVAMWIASRTSGLPFGPRPWEAEPAGLTDVIATSFEATLVAGALVLVLARNALAPARPHTTMMAALLAGFATLVLTALSLLSAVGAAKSVIPPSL